MRYVIYGAGAIGGVLGGRLHAAGHDVVLIARGAQLAALQRDGLRLQSRDRDDVHRITMVGAPADAGMTAGDVVVLAMKTQDTADALESLAAVAPPTTPILCAQNGVENERLASRWFADVYGLYVYIYALSIEPGLVQCFTAPSFGVCDLGRFPSGTDAFAERVATDLVGAGFDAVARTDIMRWKHTKLLANLGNALQVLCAAPNELADVGAEMRAEGEACFRAAGIDNVTWQDQQARFGVHLPLALVHGRAFPGGSTWQSVVRGVGRVETDYLNGEIVLLGRLTGTPTPLNERAQALVRALVAGGGSAGAGSPDEVRRQLRSDA